MKTQPIDVLSIGHASFDLVFSVDHHPGVDEKSVARELLTCGGGPAANAAVTVVSLGGTSVFAGYLGTDPFGELHFNELQQIGIDTTLIKRGAFPTPLSVILVKPDGTRSLINYSGSRPPLSTGDIDFSPYKPGVLLLDGHEPDLSIAALHYFKNADCISLLDAGSVRDGTKVLLNRVDHVVSSKRFALEYTGEKDAENALDVLSRVASSVVITLGEEGLIWKKAGDTGYLKAFEIEAKDTTGAGDVFHGAFAFGLARGMPWLDLLCFSSAAAAFCCTRMGARPAIPTSTDVETMMGLNRFSLPLKR